MCANQTLVKGLCLCSSTAITSVSAPSPNSLAHEKRENITYTTSTSKREKQTGVKGAQGHSRSHRRYPPPYPSQSLHRITLPHPIPHTHRPQGEVSLSTPNLDRLLPPLMIRMDLNRKLTTRAVKKHNGNRASDNVDRSARLRIHNRDL